MKSTMKRQCVVCLKPFIVGTSHTRNTCSAPCKLEYNRRVSRQGYFRRSGRVPPPPKPSVKLTAAQLGYLAGFIDGEGWLGITTRKRDWKRCTLPHYHRPALVIGQAKRDPLDAIASWLGHDDFSLNKERDFWMLRLHPPCLRWLLPQLLPHLILKRPQAEILLTFMSECRYQGKELTRRQWHRREALMREIKRLNVKPHSHESSRKSLN